MPKITNRIGVSLSADANWSKKDMDAICAAYGHLLPKKAWTFTKIATDFYTALAPNGRKAVPVKKLASNLEKIKKRCEDLRRQVTAEPVPKLLRRRAYFRDSKKALKHGFSMLESIDQTFFSMSADTKLSHPHDAMFPLLIHALDAFTTVAGWVRYEILDPAYEGHQDGKIWNIWIWWLTIILREANLPYQVSKATTHPSARKSDFVKFVRAIQRQLPPECQRHMHSDDALGQAIVRARKGYNLNCKFVEVFDLTSSEWPDYRRAVGH